METVFLKLTEQLNSSVFTLIAILALAFFLCYKIACVVTKFSGLEERNNKFEGNVDSIKETLLKIKTTNDLMYERFRKTVKSHSPISLTEKGIEIATEIKAREKVANHWDEIKELIKVESLSNPYDIQVECMEKAQNCFNSLFTEEEKSEIKLHAFKIGMNLMEIYPIIGVKIRDKILKEKGINVDDIDKHDPELEK